MNQNVPIVQAIPVDNGGMKYTGPQYVQNQQSPVYVAGQQNNAGQFRGLYILAVVGGCCCLVILIVSLAVALAGGEEKCDITELGVELRNGSDHVSLIFSACPSEAAFEAFTNAARRWSDAIISSPITPAILGESIDLKEQGCTEKKVVLGPDHALDHLVIVAETLKLDGVGGILAQAGPCFFDIDATNDALVTVIGVMTFDNADLKSLEDDGTIESVILHEMGHVLGLGTLWSFVAQGGVELGTAQVLAGQGLLRTPIFPPAGGVQSNNIPHFIGTAAVAEFSTELGGTLVGGNNGVPVEDGKSNDPGNPFFNTAQGEGGGSVDGHWKKTVFDTELLTFSISSQDALHPLSAMSILSLEDLGYEVNVSVADAYSLPVTRTSKQLSKDAHILKGDVFDKFLKDPLKRVPMSSLFDVKKIGN